MSEHDHAHEHDRGLSHDLPTLLNRRRALGLFGGAGLIATLAACGGDSSTPPDASSSASTPTTATTTSGEAIPEETGGPYPADGTNGVNVLTESGIVRSDITSSFGGSGGVAEGIPLTFTLTLVDVSGSGVGEGAAVYAWHCDRDGAYSMYDQGVEDQNYLRGVQAADSGGSVTFTSIFPAAYSGRWPHIHFEIYPSLVDATAARNRLRTSQLALPQDVCEKVYATEGYEQSVRNLAGTSLDSDMVFRDGYSLQLAKVTGSVGEGFTATLRVPI